MSGTEAWQLVAPLLSGIADSKEGCEAYVMVYRALKEMDEAGDKDREIYNKAIDDFMKIISKYGTYDDYGNVIDVIDIAEQLKKGE